MSDGPIAPDVIRPRIAEVVRSRVFAQLYDAGFAMAERSGLRELRRRVLKHAAGITVEVGAGTGLNLAHYPLAVTELLLTEPDPHMANRLRARSARSSMRVEVCEASAQALPVGDGTVDTVVCTLVLCSVSDPDAVLREMARVLRPGGRLLFIEHVRSTSPRLAKWQDRLHVPWGWLAHGCQCNRDTLAAIIRSPLAPETIRDDRLHWISPLLHPLIVGSATR